MDRAARAARTASMVRAAWTARAARTARAAWTAKKATDNFFKNCVFFQNCVKVDFPFHFQLFGQNLLKKCELLKIDISNHSEAAII